MASESSRRARAARPAALAVLMMAAASFDAAAADGARTYIYQCDLNGKKVTSDRPIPECINKDQRQLNPDGSLRSILTPTLTDDERAEKERLDREREVERVAKNDAVRRDRNLMQRFPNEAEHNKARTKALDDLKVSTKNSEAQKSLAQNQESEVARINKLYDVELVRLKKLWAGAQPGSLGPVPGPQALVPPAPAPTALKTSSQ
jgi:hypothetical protein